MAYENGSPEMNQKNEEQLKVYEQLLKCVRTLYYGHDADSAIQDLLEIIGKFHEANRAYIFEYDLEHMLTSNTYEWCKEGVSSEIARLQNVPIEEISRWEELFDTHGVVSISKLDEEVDPSTMEYKTLAVQGIDSLLVAPLVVDGVRAGFIGVDDPVVYPKNTTLLESVAAFICDDIHKRRQEEMETEMRALEAANRAKTEFISRISHDIRTPIGAVLNLTEFAKADIDNPEKLKDDLDKIATSGKFLLSLINDVLDISKIDSGKIELRYEPYSFKEYVDAIRNVMEPMCQEKGIEAQMEIQAPPAEYAMVDKVRLNQVTLNVISNAVKYTPRGGYILFSCKFTGLEDGKMGFDIHVKDDGIGMSEEFQAHVFEEFSQEMNNPGRGTEMTGSGLGLAIVNRLIRLMGGSISIESELGKGTDVGIHLVLSSADDTAARTIRSSAGAADGRKLDGRILFAEDNEINTEIAKRIFEEIGVTPEHAANGREAVEMMSAAPEGYYRAIFMDIQMPEMNGYEATAAIRGLARTDAKTIPIIAMTADAFTDAVKKAGQSGMTAFTTKPLKPAELREILVSELI